MMSMLGASISGVVVAVIAKFLLPGKQRVSGIEMFLIGTGAAWLGGFLAGLIGWGDGRGIHFGVLAIQVAIAAVAIWLWTNFRNKQVKQAVVPGPPRDKDGKKDINDKKDKDDEDKKIDMPGPL
ncbi:MAG: hypothetical protein U9R25_20485 [Chloroflexota bacterium]|nr:hypothetical protein [Chloroflexota bacterium]